MKQRHALWIGAASILAVTTLIGPAFGGTLTTEIIITGNINGEPLAGTGTSTLDTDSGVANTQILFTLIPAGHDVIAYGKSHKTKHHPKKPPVAFAPVANFDDLSPAGYSFNTTITYDGGVGTLVNTGQVVPTGPGQDRYELDVQGTYSGPVGAVGIQAFDGTFQNVPGVPGDISMTDSEIIEFGGGGTLGLTETGTFTLFSGATLPLDPQLLVFDPVVVSFDPGTGILDLRTRAVFIPEPMTVCVLIIGSLAALAKRK